ncbi:MAG TPA: type III polyketide synthase [Acidocella sp.]|jgi:predicted naringenin-chalcone synthase|uniref:type III polyketide synthase n=1 Tax=Acidocella sp. TaxID=50710 RepID=UPI002B83C143|nr:type III polyketide synthase [Acidocella sp.]HVE23242.1 type III polyketide synthase [Acidocella sp.]
MMKQAYINRIGTAVPPHDIHAAYRDFMAQGLDERPRAVFERMADRAAIVHRYSVLAKEGMVEADEAREGFYRRGAYPGTATRMSVYAVHAPELAMQAIEALGRPIRDVTHLVLASCTGFIAPGLDQVLAQRLGLRPDLQRLLVGFMGCCAAVPALRAAQAIVLADPAARVLVVNVELCTLHLQETKDLEAALSFLLFGDGAAAALVTAEPEGVRLGDFASMAIPETSGHITWHIGDQGFLMHLSGKVPGAISHALRESPHAVLREDTVRDIDLWAVHGGGRTVLDAVQAGLDLPAAALAPSRAVLAAHGNMSSATVMFVLAGMMQSAAPGQRGLAMAFGPGMVAETFRFTGV